MSHGVTSVGDMGWGLFGSGNLTWEDLEHVYDPAAADDSMPVRCVVYSGVNMSGCVARLGSAFTNVK